MLAPPEDQGPSTAPAPEPGLALSAEWADWLIENYVDGVPSAQLKSTLLGAQVPEAVADVALRELHANTFLGTLRQKVVARDQLHQLVMLRRQLSHLPRGQEIERRANVSGDEFFERYYQQNQPVVLTDVADRWPALERWGNPHYFAEKFGDTELTVCMGREGDPHCDRNFAKYLQTMTMRQYAAWLTNAGETNDGYLISNNRLLENPAFDELLADIVPPEAYVEPSRFRTYMSFWLGPKGTVTPLHHDGNNILFCQVAGRKEFYLVSPWETELLHRAEGYYAPQQVPSGWEREGRRPADDAFPWPAWRVVLSPGEALFLPVGWWHQVRALDLSASISFLNFREENHFHWYAPGKLNER